MATITASRPRAPATDGMRILRRTALALLLLAALALGTFALPVTTWRTGELDAPPLAIVEGGPAVGMPARIWIDTDAACGHGPTTDPDDCLAILLLALAPEVEIAGISTVHGNAPLDVVDRTTRDLAAVLERSGIEIPPVHRGSAGPVGEGQAAGIPAHEALRAALEEGPLTLLALGPMTNLAAVLDGGPELQANVGRLVAVMGRRPGHLFHPAEGAEGGILFGHGPVFRDFNFDMDRAAAAAVLGMGLPTTLMPYDAARNVSLTGDDLAALEASGGAAEWVASRARGWLGFWRDDIGRNGFYPFDLLAAAYVLAPGLFDCAEAEARVGEDRRLWDLWFHDPDALLVGPARGRPESPVVYCVGTAPDLHDRMMRRLLRPAGNAASG